MLVFFLETILFFLIAVCSLQKNQELETSTTIEGMYILSRDDSYMPSVSFLCTIKIWSHHMYILTLLLAVV